MRVDDIPQDNRKQWLLLYTQQIKKKSSLLAFISFYTNSNTRFHDNLLEESIDTIHYKVYAKQLDLLPSAGCSASLLSMWQTLVKWFRAAAARNHFPSLPLLLHSFLRSILKVFRPQGSGLDTVAALCTPLKSCVPHGASQKAIQ